MAGLEPPLPSNLKSRDRTCVGRNLGPASGETRGMDAWVPPGGRCPRDRRVFLGCGVSALVDASARFPSTLCCCRCAFEGQQKLVAVGRGLRAPTRDPFDAPLTRREFLPTVSGRRRLVENSDSHRVHELSATYTIYKTSTRVEFVQLKVRSILREDVRFG